MQLDAALALRGPFLLWAVLFITLPLVIGAAAFRQRKVPGWKAACADLVVLCLAAYIVRQWLTDTIVLDWPTRLPGPGQSGELRNGPGYSAFANLCFLFGGWSDRSADQGALIVGALTAAPVYLLVRFSTGRRDLGLWAGGTLALLAPHARISNAEDPASLVALLLVLALALVEGARLARDPWLSGSAVLAAALAASTRPEVFPSFVVVLALLALSRTARMTLLRPAGFGLLGTSCALLAITVSHSVAVRRAAHYPISLAPAAEVEAIANLLIHHLVILPPAAPVLFGVLVLAGAVLAIRPTRGRSLLWLAAGLGPAIAAAPVSGNWVSDKHQAASLPVAAALAGIALGALSDRLVRVASVTGPRSRGWGVAATGGGAMMLLGSWLLRPPVLPTFVLEYQFFSSHLAAIPTGCSVMTPSMPAGPGPQDFAYLDRHRGSRLKWIRVGEDSGESCLLYWRPSGCDSALVPPSWDSWIQSFRDWNILHLRDDNQLVAPLDCWIADQAYRLDPLADTRLPARFGYAGYLRGDQVRVGFYRAQRVAAATPVRAE